jgi:hypothetical protein
MYINRPKRNIYFYLILPFLTSWQYTRGLGNP